MNYFDNIPQELKKLNRWVCWHIEERKGKPTKVPLNPKSKGNAMVNNPDTWGTYNQAVKRLQREDLPGIGFMFNNDGVIGVDVDHCRDENGSLNALAANIIFTMNSYTEYSQSGNGIHIICYGKIPGEKRRKDPVEMYETARFFVMTGNVLDDAHKDIEERTSELAIIHEKYIESKVSEKKSKNLAPAPAAALGDDEIIEKAMAAKNGDRFESLMNGNWKGYYSSQSEADLALCNLLAFWTGNDFHAIDRIFRRSGLYREKWMERHGAQTYGEMTIQEAIAGTQKTYTPKQKQSKPAHQDPPEIDMGYDQLVKDAESNEDAQEQYDTTSDLGRSKYFSVKFKDKLYYCSDMRSWLIWDEGRWKVDRTLQVMNKAKDTVKLMIKEAGKNISGATGEDQVKKAQQVYRETLKGKSERSIKSMIELAKSDMPITAGELDKDPYLLNCKNGIVDLRTGKLIKHDPKYKQSKIADANYVPGKQFEKFGQFLQDIALGDDELIKYFQQICGMAAIGKVFYEGIAIFYGGGRNGKSTFLNTINKTFGDYASSLKPELLMFQKDGRDPVGLADIAGRRFVTAIETEEGKRISSSMLKQLASTDPITARRLYENPITFFPSHTLIMATNFLPKISSTDVGTWRRLAVVPFKAKFEGRKEVKDYASVLHAADADAIFTWIAEGAKMYIENNYNLDIPKVVQDATAQYRAAEDWLGNFLSDCCEEGEFEESGGDLYDSYREWCNKNNESYVRRSRDFATAMEGNGYEKRRTNHGSVWKGLHLLESAQASSLSKYKSNKGKTQSSILDDDDLDEYTRKKM